MKKPTEAQQRTRAGFTRKAKARQRTMKAPLKAPKMEIKPSAVYTVAQMAEILQVQDKTARAILTRGEIPGRKIGREWRILGENIRAYIADFRPLAAVGLRQTCKDSKGDIVCQCYTSDTYTGLPIKDCEYGKYEGEAS